MISYRIFSGATLLLFLPLAGGCNQGAERTEPQPWTALDDADQQFEVELTRPNSSGKLTTSALETDDTPVGIACATCHGEGSNPAFANHDGAERNFHANVGLTHGTLSCGDCHTLSSPDKLHTSAGETFPLAESQKLCSQCHGLIRKAYDHGAHGGMRGHWDLSRGPQQRNDCISCHSPHSPAYPKVMPVPGPKDRNVFKKTHSGSVIDMRFGGENHE